MLIYCKLNQYEHILINIESKYSISIHDYDFENVVCKKATILS